jgi:NADPH-dependent 2,4-dienoyl-CoA reductase/sulfur reductase-like enzyme
MSMHRGSPLEFDVRHRILIVGTGPAGIAAAQEFRQLGFQGELTVMGDELEGPYDRPACSKGLLSGHQRPTDALIKVDDSLDITWKLGRRAVASDLANRVVQAHTGEMLHYDGLVVATGCRPVVPMDWPDNEPGMHVINGLSAAWDLRADLRQARRVVIVGGGVTGCEVACAVKEMAREAVIIEPRPYLMGRAVGTLVGGLIAQSHARHGIELCLDGRVSTVDRNQGWWQLTLSDGSTVAADVVVAAMGERPDTEWLENNGLDLSQGVTCDGALRVLGTQGVVAAGSLVAWPNPRNGDDKPRRCGQWIAAQEMGQTAARTLLAGDAPSPAASLLPRYWSSQLGLRIQVAGDLDAKADIEVSEMHPGRKDAAMSGVLATYHRDGRLVGVVAVNAPRAFTNLARVMLLDEPEVPMVAPEWVSAEAAYEPEPEPYAEQPASAQPAAGYAYDPRQYSDERYDDPRYRDPRYDDPRYAERYRDEDRRYAAAQYEPAGYGDPRYGDPRHEDPRYGDPRHEDPRYAPARHGDGRYEGAGYGDPRYDEPRYDEPRYGDPRYGDPRYGDPRYEDPRYEPARYGDGRYEGAGYGDPRYDEPRYDEPRYEEPRYGDPRSLPYDGRKRPEPRYAHQQQYADPGPGYDRRPDDPRDRRLAVAR